MTTRLSLVAALAVLMPSGCHSDDQASDNGGAAQNPGEGSSAEATDGGEPDTANDEGQEPQDDEPESDADTADDEPDDEPFEVPNHEARLLPYAVRMANLAALLGVERDHFIFDEINARRTILGDHDYAHGVAPDLSWSPTKMSAWVKGLTSVCSSALWRQRYPNLSADPAPLLRSTLAREPDAEDLAAYQALAESVSDPVRADELTCLAALSSLEFVAQ